MRLSAGDTLAQAEAKLTAAFRAAGIDTPALDARLLLQAPLGLDRAALRQAEGRPLSEPEAAILNQDAERRIRREALAVILGEKEFWSLPFSVTADTLVPRPDTETVVEAALAALQGRAAPQIADLGTGTGAILLSLLSERQDAFGLGVDISIAALRVAQGNAQRLSLAARAKFVRADFASALAPRRFDLIVSNPPYIAAADIARLEAEVRHEPRLALDGGTDGLTAYRAIAAQAPSALAPGGALVLEIGATQAEAVTAIFKGAGLALADGPIHDLGNNPRALVFRAK